MIKYSDLEKGYLPSLKAFTVGLTPWKDRAMKVRFSDSISVRVDVPKDPGVFSTRELLS